MSARTIPDGAGVTNHTTASFAPHVAEAGYTSISGLEDEQEVIDGPDGRGYATGKSSRKDLTVVLPMHDPAAQQMHDWKLACENGAVGHATTGTVTYADAGDNPIAIFELENCICRMGSMSDSSLDGAEVAQTTWTISYARAIRIGP